MFGFKKKEDAMQFELRKLREESEQRNATFSPASVTVSSFEMIIEDVFTITGRGTIVTGKIAKGTVQVGDTLKINGIKDTKVKGVEMFRKIRTAASAGENVGLLLAETTKSDVQRGFILTK